MLGSYQCLFATSVCLHWHHDEKKPQLYNVVIDEQCELSCQSVPARLIQKYVDEDVAELRALGNGHYQIYHTW